MALPIILGLGLWGKSMYEAEKLNEEYRLDRARERSIKEQELADKNQLRNVAATVEAVPLTGHDGSQTFAVGNQAFKTRDEAIKFAEGYNSLESRLKRQRDALIGQGKATDGMNLEKGAIGLESLRRTAAKVLRDEGVNDFIDANFARMPSVEDVKAGKAKLFDLAGVDKYNAVGADKLPEGTKGRWKVMTLPNGRELVDFEAVDPSGNSLTGPYSARVLQMLHNQSPVEREKTADQQFKEGREFDFRREQLDAQKEYWDKLGAAAETRADRAGAGGGKGASLFDRMDEADKIRLQGLKERATRIETAVSTAMANGNWDPASPAAKQLLAQQADIEQQVDKIISAYGTRAAGKPASDLGLFGDDQPAKSGQSGQGAGSERFQIIKAELSKTLARRDAAQPGTPEYVRASEDARALQAELSRLPKKEQGAMGSSAGARQVEAGHPAPAAQPMRGGLPRPLTLREAQAVANQPPPTASKVDMRGQARATQGQGLRPEDMDLLQYLR